ncbi:uncharacterized protein LOC111138153 isoform X2 [Crassostrea virginica]
MLFDPFIFLIRNNIMHKHKVTCNTFIVLIIVNLVHYNVGGCDVNDWPHSCLANFRIGKQRCEHRATYPVGSSLPPVYPVKSTHYVESSPLPTPKNHFLSNLTVSLLVSVGTVVFFGAICAVILIRVSKQFYKRQYQKFLSRWQSSELTAEDTNVYAVYSYTDSLLSTITSPTSPLNPENTTYDHSSEANYNVLSLRNESMRGNCYGGSVCRSIPPPLTFENTEYEKKTSVTTDRESDFDLEPECFLSLFDENQNDQSQNIVSPRGGSKQQNTTKL